MALKEMSEKTGLTIGTCANLMVVAMLFNVDKNLSAYSPDTQKGVIADMLAALSEIFKLASFETIRNTSLTDFYKYLLTQSEQ